MFSSPTTSFICGIRIRYLITFIVHSDIKAGLAKKPAHFAVAYVPWYKQMSPTANPCLPSRWLAKGLMRIHLNVIWQMLRRAWTQEGRVSPSRGVRFFSTFFLDIVDIGHFISLMRAVGMCFTMTDCDGRHSEPLCIRPEWYIKKCRADVLESSSCHL